MIISLGAILHPQNKIKIESILKHKAVAHDMYSLTELGVTAASTYIGYKPESAGPLAQIRCRIYNENNERCGPNEMGNLHFENRFPFLVRY